MVKLLRSLLPDALANRMRASAVLHRLTKGEAPRMRIGEGRGLRFDPGPSNRAYCSGDNELPVQAALAGCLRPGGVFYDIGANVGFMTVIGARLVGPKGLVYAFEPVPENAAYVRLNTRLNHFENVRVIEKAVAGFSGKTDLRLAEYSGGASLATASPPPDSRGTISVNTTSVDDMVFSREAPPPSAVKIDVEGAEIDVLTGMLRTLREIRPTVVFEIDDQNREALEEKYRRCEQLLRESRYQVERLADSYPNLNWLVGHAVATPS
jgi:FkbM family methyltransferase